MAAGRFRHDLFYRLNVIEIRMPALRELPDDLPELASHILTRLAAANRCPTPVLSPAALSAMAQYDFPGNVRELENILERAMALSEGRTIHLDDLNLVPPCRDRSGEGGDTPFGDLQTYLDQTEKKAILEALGRTDHNKTAAARLLGVTFRSLRYRIERLGID